MSERPALRINLAARAATAEARRARTRERLLGAAERVIAEKGVETANIEDFVAAAGVSRGTFYNYFPTTAALLQAMHTRIAETLVVRLDQLSGDIEDPAARMASNLHHILVSYADDPVRGWVAMRIAETGVPRQNAFEERFAAIFSEGVSCGRFRAVDMAAARTVVFGTIRMASRDAVTGAALPVQTAQVVALMLTALGVPYEEAEQISCQEAVAARAVHGSAV